MINIKTYLPQYKNTLLDIFKSNIPLYFAEEELVLFDAFLDRDIEKGPYYVVFNDDEIVGCGGIVINNPTKYTNKTHVLMTWGMIDYKYHKQGFGKELLAYRLEQAKILYPDTIIALGTTQHTFQFFEKYGFKTVFYEKSHWSKDLDLYQMEL